MNDSGREYVVTNPRTGERLYSFYDASHKTIEKVSGKARQAFEQIRRLSVAERLDELGKLQTYLRDHREQIVDQIVAETGKARTDALLWDLFIVLDAIAYYRKHAEKLLAEKRVPTPLLLLGKKSRIQYNPLGVVLVISPWNYPLHLSLLPCITAFLAGNSVILKPSEHTPLKGLFEEIFHESGFMQNAIQPVYGGGEIGQCLIDTQPAKIFFTGSALTGKAIMRQAADHLIPVELELGGKDPMIVFDDVNIDRTVQGALWGALVNTGQTCTSVERLYVHETIYTPFVEKLTEAFKSVFCAADTAEKDEGQLDVGTMATPLQIGVLEDHVADAVAQGAKVLVGGQRGGHGHSFQPTLLVDVNPSMKVIAEETFGPVLPVMKFCSEDEVIDMANASPYGLSASVWSGDLDRAQRVAQKLDAGNVAINNVMSTQGNFGLPFGGVKQSGFGRYHGRFGLEAFSNIKSIMIDPRQSKYEFNWYPYTREKYGLFSKLTHHFFSGRITGLIRALLIGLKVERLSQKRSKLRNYPN